MEDSRLSSIMSGPSNPVLRMERCLLGKDEVLLPEAFVDQTHIFQHVMSQDTWSSILTEDQRKHLETFLPTFSADSDAIEKTETTRRLFSGENFKFGNPLMQFHQKLKDGNLSPDIAKYASLCCKFKYREYKFSQQNYYSKLLKEIIISRQRTLGQINGLPPGQPLKFHHTPQQKHNKGIDHRVRKNCSRILKEAREECCLEDTSSEEEESISTVQKSRRQLFKSLGPIPSPEPTTPSVVATYASKPSTHNGDISSSHSSKRPRPISPVEIQEEDYREMLKNHKRKKMEAPDMPELDTQTITLQDILNRCQANKKLSKSPASINGETGPDATSDSTLTTKKKQRVREKGERKLKRKIKSEKEGGSVDDRGVTLTIPPASGNLDVHSELLTHRDDDGVPDFPLPDTLPSRLTLGQADNFFSLLRDMVCDFNDSKATTGKVEERVREWQDSPASALNSWVHQQQSWVECVIPALKFLSGDVLGLSVENFVPYVDYKERAQQWKWIGAGRDSNMHLAPLFRHWMKHKDAAPVNGLTTGQGSPPPVKVKTSYVVRPTSNGEKVAFREQEHYRFDNPHRSFTYRLHGYESVVGPVKGVYNKENAMTKAREHALLVSDRPAYVTILTLVRDAAARLPNGEGTRGDICELLKDSQFLAPGVTDTQINTVVSGALDRLHSEKDPCVKYDVNSKLWIYLHRSRTEEEFERIHEAQGAAAKAKKSLQRPKASKAIKDQVTPYSTVTTVKSALAQNAASTVSPAASLKLDKVSALVATSLAAASSPKPVPDSPVSQVRGKAGKQGAVATTHKASVLGPVVGTSPASSASTQKTASPLPATSGTPPSTPSGHKPVLQLLKTQQQATAKQRHTGVTVTQAGASILGSRPQTVGILQGLDKDIQQNSSFLASLSKPPTAAAGNTSRAPVVTVTKQGLAVVSRQNSGLELQSEAMAGISNATTARGSPVVLSQDTGSRSSTPTAITLPSGALSTASKMVTFAQAGGLVSSGSVVTTISDNPVVARLVQQMAGGTQVVSVSNLLAAGQTRVATQVAGQQRGTTLKIQGGSIVQPVVGGKPMQFTGKPLTTAKGLLQLGGKGGQPLSVIQTTQGQISTLSLIPQALTATSTASGHVVTSNSGKLSVTAVASSANAASPVTFTMVGSPVTSIGAQSKSTFLTQVTNTGAPGSPAQAKVVSPSQAGMVVTQIGPGGSISLRPSVSGNTSAKVATAGQATLVPAQFIMQQAPTASSGQVTTQGTPIIVSQAGGKGSQQNIQVVRTLLSQTGGIKPGQATILISQPTFQQAAAAGGTILSSAQVIQAGGATKTSGRGSPKGKAQPVYARIITPPPGMKLTAVGPNQVSATGNVSVLQTVKLLGLPASVASATTSTGSGNLAQPNVTTVTISTPASPHLGVAMAQNLQPSSGGSSGLGKK